MSYDEKLILEFIYNYQNTVGINVSYREIARHFNISVSTAHNRIKKLQEREYVHILTKISRSIQLTATGEKTVKKNE